MVDGVGSISPSEMQSMRSLSKQRLPIPSKHVEQPIASVDAIQKEARDKALEEAERTIRAMANTPNSGQYWLHQAAEELRALKEA